MKVFIGGELEHSISDKFRKARNSVIEYMDCLCDISYINELSFYVFCLKGFTTNPLSRSVPGSAGPFRSGQGDCAH